MFPNQEAVSTITQLNNANIMNSGGKSPSFNFELGDFNVKDGKVETVSKYEALKQWIQKTIRTDKNKYKIYNTNDSEKYGVDSLLDLIMSEYPLPYKQAQIQTIITEALLRNSDIKSVNNFVFKKDKTLLNCNFDVISVYGTSTESVVT
ncbi:hypothetical protein AXY43_19330 [Clostridium sp. MF28]|uniref:DUF2634 domain-containing protein n=1 Tax=Clostridium TaxID=1485 RepID=UPI000CF99C9A|nr:MULTISPECIES: DUF2634 domain-containing protein [Clostridium]AVK49959.1 hypothetical protein AXY43_19330 [Clostridium sp. MF28]PSM59743.1 DUF2634 domain-containing protein [Clostridium diolis]